MDDLRKAVLIGDEDQKRVSALKKILEQDFKADVMVATSYEELSRNAAKPGWALILCDIGLRRNANDENDEIEKIGSLHFNQLHRNHLQDQDIPLCCLTLTTDDPALGVPFKLHNLYVPVSKMTPPGRQQIIEKIEEISRLRRVHSLRQILWDDKNRSLRRQIRSLARKRDEKEGLEILTELVRKSLDCDQATTHQLGQGKSGARVFLVHASKKGRRLGDYVFKLSRYGDVEKIQNEIRGYKDARGYLQAKQYSRNAAELRRPLNPDNPEGPEMKYVVTSNGWYAIRYDFIGGKRFGTVLDLETALIASPLKLQQKLEGTSMAISSTSAAEVYDLRIQIFETILNWLRDHWYMRAKHVKRQKRLLWNFDEAVHSKYSPKPPYSLSPSARDEILSFLESREADLGDGFFPNWETIRKKVIRFVEGEETDIPGLLKQPLSVVVSPSHGDLNSNNVLLWLDEKHPFLIDFPFFQKDGHGLQDLAQLEAEIKFALMDRQGGGSKDKLKAADHTYTQMDLWREMEEHLLDPDSCLERKRQWRQNGYKENVKLCFDLIWMLRQKAYKVQRQRLNEKKKIPSFEEEYFPVLLYYTLRCIGYDSLSPFKRLLAVHSAGLLLEELER